MKKLLLFDSTKSIKLFFTLAMLALLSTNNLIAQCSNASPYGTATLTTATGSSGTVFCNYGGEYGTWNGVAAFYSYTTTSTVATDFITVRSGSAAGPVVAFGTQPLTWIATTTGPHYIHINTNSACGTVNACRDIVTVNNGSVAPATPPTPTQSAGLPTCFGGTSLSVTGTPATNVQWYWQTTSTGTSTALPYAGPYTVFANGTYFLRGFNSFYSLWSASSSSITITNFTTATPPPAAVASVNPSCAPAGSSLTAVAAPAGYNYYWQGIVSGGSSTALPATTPYSYTASGTYYLAALETATGCWSNGVGTSVTVDNYIPAAPIVSTNNYNICTGATTLPISVSAAPSNGSTSVNIASNYTWVPGVATLTGNISIPAGATVTSSTLTFNGVTTTGSTWLNDLSFNMTGSSTINTTLVGGGFGVTNGGPYNFTPTTNSAGGSFSLNLDNAWFSNATISSITLNINYTLPATSIAWYDAVSGGNLIGTGTPFETVGSSVLANPATFGNYEFFVGYVSGGCQSASRELITVNAVNVNAVLTPINATCNGGANGSFALGAVQCGATPFTYSIDNGVTFGAIPTNLTAGNYAVLIQDANGLQSGNIAVVIGQPAAPANVVISQINYFTADVSWTTTGNETQWNVEVGPTGFTPGTGTSYTSSTTSYTIPGLTEDTEYDVYISALCGPNPVPSNVVTFSTNPGFFTFDNQCGPGFTDISSTGTALNLCDDCTTTITTTNTVSVNQSVPTNTITVSNNGWIQFAGVTLNAWLLDLDTESGNVYWEEANIAGDDYLIVEWYDRPRWPGVIGQAVTFELMVNQTTGEVYYIYDDVVFGGSQASNDYGLQGTINAVTPSGTTTVSNNNATYLTNNSCVHFYNALCPNPTNMTSVVLQEQINLDWTAGAYGETEWTVIYGLAGFDPATSGTILTTTASDIQITGLNQLTEYDIYVYSECAVDNLTSGGFLVNATTLPWCADPITVSGTSAVDSIFMTWDWIPVATATNGGISSFNMTYGQTNFDLYANGTELVANGVNFTDSIVDATFLPGQVIDVYVQAVCGVDSSNYVGPFTITMPISNDTVCGAAELMVDGTVYIFNNTGATVTAGETGIVPTQTGYNDTDLPQVGWGQPTLQRTTWFTFTAPASGSMRFSGEDVDAFWSQIAIYDAPLCNDFNTFDLLAASDQATVTITTVGNTTTIDTFKVAPNFTICGLTPGETYYIMHDSWAGATGAATFQGQYSIAMTPITLEAGTFVDVIDACTGTSVVLFDGITGFQPAGAWTAELAPVGTGLTDSLFNTSGLGYQVFNFEYRVTDGCAYDSIVSQVQIFPLSSAGTDGSITVCKNEPIDLLEGLGGNVDFGGSWYNPSNQLMPSSSIIASGIPGLFNYDYITGNGVCPDDTANVLLTVDPSCDYLNVQEMYFSSMTMFPNPTNGLVYITNEGNSEVFNYEVIDIDGRVIATKANAINGASTTTIDLTGKVTGMYMIRVYNGNAEKVFRVVLQ